MTTESYTIFYSFTANANSEGDTTIVTVPDRGKLKVTKAKFFFPTGSNQLLSVYIKRGNEQVIPTVGSVSGDDVLIEIETDVLFNAGIDIVVHYKNIDTTNSHNVGILLIGELEVV